MANVVFGEVKKCVTCQYYKGERILAPSQKNVMYFTPSGLCEMHKKRLKGRMPACDAYIKWNVII
ncbi:MAG: hypothetical protein LBC41_08950 [Clostridiales bacterium]|jgi:hypothetical protein|nr:hypothetical protein [Clostridiales bacterium]MDR2750774.1 hypothetical protein [Clostridiales bacterium]